MDIYITDTNVLTTLNYDNKITTLDPYIASGDLTYNDNTDQWDCNDHTYASICDYIAADINLAALKTKIREKQGSELLEVALNSRHAPDVAHCEQSEATYDYLDAIFAQ